MPRPRSTWAASRSSTATAWNGPWRSRLATRRRATGVSRSGHSCMRPTSGRDRLAGRPAAGPGGARCAGAPLRPLRRLRGRRPGGAGGGHGPVARAGGAGETPRGGGDGGGAAPRRPAAPRRRPPPAGGGGRPPPRPPRRPGAPAPRGGGGAAPPPPPPAGGEAYPDLEARGPTGDDTLTLLFLCCHPALTPPSQVALTLRAVGGLSTAEIARAFLVPEATMAQRISRAKQRIKATGASFDLPPPAEQAERLGVVLHVVYLVFNEGYTATSGAQLVRAELTAEA